MQRTAPHLWMSLALASLAPAQVICPSQNAQSPQSRPDYVVPLVAELAMPIDCVQTGILLRTSIFSAVTPISPTNVLDVVLYRSVAGAPGPVISISQHAFPIDPGGGRRDLFEIEHPPLRVTAGERIFLGIRIPERVEFLQSTSSHPTAVSSQCFIRMVAGGAWSQWDDRRWIYSCYCDCGSATCAGIGEVEGEFLELSGSHFGTAGSRSSFDIQWHYASRCAQIVARLATGTSANTPSHALMGLTSACPTMTWTPATQGAVGSVQLTVDYHSSVTTGFGGHRLSLFAAQRPSPSAPEKFYISYRDPIDFTGRWLQWLTITQSSVTRDDFYEIWPPNPMSRPDFSASGQPIRFGIAVWIEAPAGSAHSEDGLYDNLRITVLPSGGSGSIRYFGTPCAGHAGPPAFRIGGEPRVGTTLTFDTGNSIPVEDPTVLFLGASSTQWLGYGLPLDLAFMGSAGCYIYASIDVILHMGPPGTIQVPIPANPGLAGIPVYFQMLAWDTTPRPVISTAAVQLILGS